MWCQAVLFSSFILLTVSAHVRFVKPDNYTLSCPGQPCLTLDNYAQKESEYFTSGATFVFLAGTHILQTRIILTNTANITLSGEVNDRGSTRVLCMDAWCKYSVC